MPPTDGIQDQCTIQPTFIQPQPTENPSINENPPPPPPPPEQFYFGPQRSEFQLYGSQQRDRLERFFSFGAAGMSNSMFAYRGQAFSEASQAYHRVIDNEIANFTGSSNTIDITNQALTEYRDVLNRYGISPSEAPSFSVLNATDFLNAESTRNGGLFTLDQNALRNLAQTGGQPQYFARMLYTGSGGAINDPNQRLAFYDATTGQGKTIAWSTTVEDLAGSRMDYREVMSRIGWTANDIATANPNDFRIIVFTEEAANRLQIPTNQTIIDTARADSSNFARFQTQPDSFWQDVVSYDYESRLAQAQALGFDMRTNANAFISTLPAGEQDIMQARYQMERTMGVNPLFTGDGTTMRPDAINGRVGVREFITDNTVNSATLLEMSRNGQVAFLEMQDLNTVGDPVNIVSEPTTMPRLTQNQMLFAETRQGGLIGGTLSAATSLPQVFEQYQNGDYLGATQTFVGNTALGTGVGAFSAAGEQYVGNQFASRLGNSTLAQNSLDRLYTNGAARNFVSRFAGTEASNITSQTFNSTARTIAGRVGGAGVVGGVVNGAFSAYDQIGAYNRGEVTASQAIGTVTGETVVGVGAGMAGAAAGAAIGSIIPGAGTIVGGIIGFGVGMAAGYLADRGLRGLGVNTLIAEGVTATIDAGAQLVGQVQELGGQAVEAVSNTFNDAADAVGGALSDAGNAISGGLRSIFG